MKKQIVLALSILAFTILANAQTATLETFSTGYNWLTGFEKAPGDDRLFVFQKNGFISICNAGGTKEATPFLDISGQVLNDGERGLVGLAFHPNYQLNGLFYTFYNRASDGACTISRWKRSDLNPSMADPTSEGVLLTFDHPGQNHVGGCMKFGPDGYLYIASGDGGGAGDPNGNGQNLLSFLGKILRIDVGNGSAYSVPTDNPFVGVPNAAPEIWAYGLRNPWRFSFDSWTGDLWIADVGQNQREEIDFQPVGSLGGQNYGWSCKEGTLDFNANQCFAGSVYTDPIYEYGHMATPVSGWCYGSITGGVVYRGYQYADLFGKYIFTDFCSGKIWALAREGDNVEVAEIGDFGDLDFSDLGENSKGELFLTGHNTNTIYQIKSANCAPVAWIPVPDTVMLIGASIQLPLYQSSGFSYQWLLNGNPVPNATAPNLTAMAPGNYSVVVTNTQNGCSNTSNVVVVVPVSLTAFISTQTQTCIGESNALATATALSGIPPYEYLWSNGQTSPFLTMLPTGNYTVTVTDAAGATATATATITAYPPIETQIVVQNVACFGGNDGSISGTASSTACGNWGIPPLQNLSAGTYTFPIMDCFGCIKVIETTVLEPFAELMVDAQVVQPTPGADDGSISFAVNGGTPPYLIECTCGAGANLPAGVYDYNITDASGCSISGQIALDPFVAAQEQGMPFGIEIFPNPVKDELNIAIDLPYPIELTIKAYDVFGQQVASLSDGNIYRAGSFSNSTKTDGWPSGAYFIAISIGQELVYRKVIVGK
ncbi:MAG: PQQ-dependent sugar dehydrogenase [Saprospiraceae bacterium]